jgi:F0F1-type ATP synthase assembly protein I
VAVAKPNKLIILIHLTVLLVREYNLYQWEAQLKVSAKIVGEAQAFYPTK